MNRNFKAIGLALVAALAMTAALASGAQAQIKVTVGSSPAWSTGEVTEHPNIGQNHTFTLSGGQKLSCEEIRFTATVTNGATSSIVVPTYHKCTVVIGSEIHLATITLNDCVYVFHGGVEVSGGTTFKEVEVDLVCPTGKEVEVHVYKSATTETEELCTYKIAPFINNRGNETHNVAGSPDNITITGTVSGIATTRTGSLLCGAASTTGTATGTVTVKAFSDEGGTISNGTVSELKEGAQTSLTASK